MLRPLRTLARVSAVPWACSDAIEVLDLIHDDEDLPPSKIGTNGESSLPSSRLMTTVTDETFESADVQLVTEFNNETPPPQLVLMTLFRYLLWGE